jgi:hypothetical protein
MFLIITLYFLRKKQKNLSGQFELILNSKSRKILLSGKVFDYINKIFPPQSVLAKKKRMKNVSELFFEISSVKFVLK